MKRRRVSQYDTVKRRGALCHCNWRELPSEAKMGRSATAPAAQESGATPLRPALPARRLPCMQCRSTVEAKMHVHIQVGSFLSISGSRLLSSERDLVAAGSTPAVKDCRLTAVAYPAQPKNAPQRELIYNKPSYNFSSKLAFRRT